MKFNGIEMLGIQELIDALTKATNYTDTELCEWLVSDLSQDIEINEKNISRPPFYKFDSGIFYRMEDLWEWFEQFRFE